MMNKASPAPAKSRQEVRAPVSPPLFYGCSWKTRWAKKQENTKSLGSPVKLQMTAYKMPCLSRVCCQRGIQMGTPEQGTPGQPQCTDGESTEARTRSPEPEPGLWWSQQWRWPEARLASRPSLPPAGTQLPRSVSTGGGCPADLGARCHQPLGAPVHL